MGKTNESLLYSSFVKYLLQMFRPRLVLMAVLIIYFQGKSSHSVNGNVHAEISENGEIYVHSPSKVLSKIKFETSGDGSNSEEPPAVGPFVGNAEFVQPSEMNNLPIIRKRDCEMPSIASRGLLGTTLKRSYFAVTDKEVKSKIRAQEESDHQMKKRTTENSEGNLPWTCETKYEWKDMGTDHYPRFVRTAECKSKFCVQGFFRCKPRRYKTKILRRITGTESTSCEDDDVSLPETLRSSWRFITVTINLCCDCTGPGRILGSIDN